MYTRLIRLKIKEQNNDDNDNEAAVSFAMKVKYCIMTKIILCRLIWQWTGMEYHVAFRTISLHIP